jgi:hypothetical protein
VAPLSRARPSTALPDRHARLRAAALIVLALLVAWPMLAGGLYSDWGRFVGLWQATLAVALVFAPASPGGLLCSFSIASSTSISLWSGWASSSGSFSE